MNWGAFFHIPPINTSCPYNGLVNIQGHLANSLGSAVVHSADGGTEINNDDWKKMGQKGKTWSARRLASSPRYVWVPSTWSPEKWITAILSFRYVSSPALINQGWVPPGGLTGPLSICSTGLAWTGHVLVAGCYLLQIANTVMGGGNGG